MNGISNKSSERANRTENTQPVKSVETAGSLAMNSAFNYFAVDTYDSFTTNNPFAVNYANYANVDGETVACGGFLSDFSNAVSTLGSGDCGSACSASASGSSSGGCSGGGFTSFC